MSLYQLAEEYRHIAWIADNLPDEEKDESFNLALAALKDSIEESAKNLSHVYRELEGNAEMQAKEANRLMAKSKRTARRAENIKRFVKEQMIKCGTKQVDWKTGSAVVQKTGGPPTLKIDESELPLTFWKETIKKTPNRDAIMHALQNGGNVKGVTVEERGQHLRFN